MVQNVFLKGDSIAKFFVSKFVISGVDCIYIGRALHTGSQNENRANYYNKCAYYKLSGMIYHKVETE